jgi:hypothetical protein
MGYPAVVHWCRPLLPHVGFVFKKGMGMKLTEDREQSGWIEQAAPPPQKK